MALKPYMITFSREVRQTCTLHVQARNEEDADGIAQYHQENNDLPWAIEENGNDYEVEIDIEGPRADLVPTGTIDKIKAYRLKHGCSLKEAADAIRKKYG